MTGSDSFGENPFRALAAEKFPDKDKKRQPGKSVSQERSRRISRANLHKGRTTAGDDGADAEDCELFLHAVGQVCAPEKGRGKRKPKNVEQSGAFLLEEHCALPGKKLTAQKNKKRSPWKVLRFLGQWQIVLAWGKCVLKLKNWPLAI